MFISERDQDHDKKTAQDIYSFDFFFVDSSAIIIFKASYVIVADKNSFA